VAARSQVITGWVKGVNAMNANLRLTGLVLIGLVLTSTAHAIEPFESDIGQGTQAVPPVVHNYNDFNWVSPGFCSCSYVKADGTTVIDTNTVNEISSESDCKSVSAGLEPALKCWWQKPIFDNLQLSDPWMDPWQF